MKITYLSAAQTAKLVRAALKRSFPTTKFSVRTRDTGSIDVSWTDGPIEAMVKSVAGQFRGAEFDGSIDMEISHNSWLLPDGTATVATCEGTAGSMGCIQPVREWMPHPEAKLVSFGSRYIFTTRNLSPAFAARVVAAAERKWGALDVKVVVSNYDGSAHISGAYENERRAYQVASRFMSVRGA